ncbi:hypothetical protein J6590_032375 [Homalodisca vitripennis]|nr:hypothetical protein J6590_032375 [Homalodisca vitripennis]
MDVGTCAPSRAAADPWLPSRHTPQFPPQVYCKCQNPVPSSTQNPKNNVPALLQNIPLSSDVECRERSLLLGLSKKPASANSYHPKPKVQRS